MSPPGRGTDAGSARTGCPERSPPARTTARRRVAGSGVADRPRLRSQNDRPRPCPWTRSALAPGVGAHGYGCGSTPSARRAAGPVRPLMGPVEAHKLTRRRRRAPRVRPPVRELPAAVLRACGQALGSRTSVRTTSGTPPRACWWTAPRPSNRFSRMVGHASTAMTLDVHSGLFDDDLRALAERMGAVHEAYVTRRHGA